MRRFAAAVVLGLAAASLPGCSEFMTWGNPYDTSSEVAHFEYMEEQASRLVMSQIERPPQSEPARFTDPELEAWRDTYLAVVDANELAWEKKRTEAKVASLKSRFVQVMRSDPHTRKEQELRLSDELRIELVRLKMIEFKLETGSPRRSD
jgi:hypothetical protein